MKLNAFALMLIFMSFVTLPSILSNVCKDVDMSSVFNFAEEKEEKHKSGAEQNGEFASSFYNIEFYNQEIGFITANFLFWHKNSSLEIFLPPPNQLLV